MKKLLLSAAILGLVITTSCSKDDDGAARECVTCNMSGLTAEYCDNGDGTMDMTVGGQTETMDLDGTNFNDYINALRQMGMCN